jgi:hypothetical protein
MRINTTQPAPNVIWHFKCIKCDWFFHSKHNMDNDDQAVFAILMRERTKHDKTCNSPIGCRITDIPSTQGELS